MLRGKTWALNAWSIADRCSGTRKMLANQELLTSKAKTPGALLVLVLVVTLAHFLLDRVTHSSHILHIILAGLYFIPIIGGAVWFGARGAVGFAAVCSVSYYLHIRFSWANQPMENANQYGWVATFWILGIISGVLIDLERNERDRRVRAERTAEREAVIEGIAGLSNALRARDEYTREHSEHVSKLATELARRLGLNGERLELVRLSALVHDVGKIGVRDDVLLKPDELSPEERAEVERHPIVAAEILRPIRGARDIAEIVLAHHACPDGSGYPNRLTSAQIPLEAHVVRVADVFACLTEKRPYKPPLDAAVALKIMEGLAGSKLDAGAFCALKEVLVAGSQICSDAGSYTSGSSTVSVANNAAQRSFR